MLGALLALLAAAALHPAGAETPSAVLDAAAMPGLAPPAVLDAAAVPYLTAAGRADYRRFLLQATPRVFALAADGSWGWASAQPDMAATEARALLLCAQWGGKGCKVYARDLSVVWYGDVRAPGTPPGEVFAAGPGWSLLPDARFLWQGPGQARGAYVWAHGRAAGGQDSRGSQPQPHVRVFNNAGWDVFRFDRDPATDETEAAAGWMRAALKEVRRRGYARIIAGGQSRGGWNALQALSEPGLVDAVVAVAPAAHGARGSPAWAWALDDLRRVVAAARSPAARVAVVTFAGDEFDPDPTGRAAILRGLNAPHVGALLFLDRPVGLSGHGGGAEAQFTLRYGDCLLGFVEGQPGCPR
ncbi:hypothetical protein JYK14_18975 [Siccirubricoccus sp. KC 17139]|uniref:DUF4189 domain-containing protein n=1 Tax=Siccirubricoccus soli TaxID=2899147 RepID=A0ABT1D8K5_9PROT|nr:hypothetical protein [Siccirubricoccus soli]MCP2684366.1 hypothetical protein [Siccirubricoccus soli]